MALTHYIIVRRDLPLGVVCAQLTHAAGESASFFQGSPDDPDGRFKGCRAVVLGVHDEVELLKARNTLMRAGIPSVVVVESDPPYMGQCMAIGVVPVNSEHKVDAGKTISDVMRPFQLLRELIPLDKAPDPA